VSIHRGQLARPLPPLPAGALPDGPVAYLDIETTGLKPAEAQVTLVGLVYAEGGVRRLEQHFVASPDEEAEVLRTVGERLEQFAGVITYNGTTFDLPFLKRRAKLFGLTWPDVENYDLLAVARAWKQEYGHLPDCRLQTVMAHFRVGREDATSGLEMIDAYYRWLQAGRPADRDLILAHNADDLLLLPDLVPHLTAAPGAVRLA
jgi:uncharacterized protein YprB with RNaseH-like and TPR domain